MKSKKIMNITRCVVLVVWAYLIGMIIISVISGVNKPTEITTGFVGEKYK